jgi:Mn-dependent DtxR family transcriptional regulator
MCASACSTVLDGKDQPVRSSEAAAQLDLAEPTVRKELGDMAKKGQISKTSRGRHSKLAA